MSVFRFLSQPRPGAYSVWRGEQWIGHVTKNTHRIHGKTIVTGWTPTTTRGRELPRFATREDAATALWRAHEE